MGGVCAKPEVRKKTEAKKYDGVPELVSASQNVSSELGHGPGELPHGVSELPHALSERPHGTGAFVHGPNELPRGLSGLSRGPGELFHLSALPHSRPTQSPQW